MLSSIIYLFFVEQLNCWSSERDQNQEVDFEIGSASGTKKVGGAFNIETVMQLKF